MDRIELDVIQSHLLSANGIALDEGVARWYRRDVPKLLAEIESLQTQLQVEGLVK